MTIDEAIKDIQENIKPIVGGRSLDMAVRALERQMPKKPNRSKDKWYGNIVLSSIPPKYYWDCPNCESMIGWDKQYNYCPNCGQRIDWEWISEVKFYNAIAYYENYKVIYKKPKKYIYKATIKTLQR